MTFMQQQLTGSNSRGASNSCHNEELVGTMDTLYKVGALTSPECAGGVREIQDSIYKVCKEEDSSCTSQSDGIEASSSSPRCKEGGFICAHEGCHFVASRKGVLSKHIRTHNVEEKVRLPSCTDDVFNAVSNASNSLSKKHKRKPFACSYIGCCYSSNNNGDLIKHTRIHTGEKPYKCANDGCDYACTSSGDLYKHARTHAPKGNQLLKCYFNGCEFVSSTRSILATHLKTHSGRKPHKCDVCDYSCVKKFSLTIHMRSHTGEKPYKCPYKGCGYACAASGTLTTHFRIHTGEKPHACKYEGCVYASAKSSDLRTHIRIHTGEKPYKCTYEGCVYACTNSGDLNKHRRIHRR
jgi:uncharacterized Zn-finger protein